MYAIISIIIIITTTATTTTIAMHAIAHRQIGDQCQCCGARNKQKGKNKAHQLSPFAQLSFSLLWAVDEVAHTLQGSNNFIHI